MMRGFWRYLKISFLVFAILPYFIFEKPFFLASLFVNLFKNLFSKPWVYIVLLLGSRRALSHSLKIICNQGATEKILDMKFTFNSGRCYYVSYQHESGP